ncbi:hypothetical protein D3C85_1183480 [compost metagenome]
MGPLACQRQRRHGVAGVQRLPHVAPAAARQDDQTIQSLQPFATDFSAALALVRQEGLGEQFAQIQVALVVAHQQQQAEGLGQVLVVGDPDIAARDGLYARPARALVELDQTEQVRQVGQRDGGLAQLGDTLDEVGDTHRTVHHRKLGVDAQVNKWGRSCYGFGHCGIVLGLLSL